MKRRNVLGMLVGAAGAATVGGGLLGAAAQETVTTAAARGRGGSNYNWYRLDGCTREPYGVVNSFHKAPATIRTQLANLRSAGQARLRIGIYHRNGPDTGTVMNSGGGTLSAANRANLTNLLAAVKAAGFSEIQIAYHPIGGNDPTTWTAWNESRYQENWNLVHNLRPLVRAAGIPYRIDLLNEGVPAPGQSVLLRYAKRIWQDYTYTHGKSDTLGVSCIGELPRVQRLKEVYGSNPPYLFDFHFYGDEYNRFVAANSAVKQLGYGAQGWIIGEAYYNSATAADRFSRAMTATGRTVHYLCQWPIHRDRRCEHVDVAPPTSYGNYRAKGF